MIYFEHVKVSSIELDLFTQNHKLGEGGVCEEEWSYVNKKYLLMGWEDYYSQAWTFLLNLFVLRCEQLDRLNKYFLFFFTR